MTPLILSARLEQACSEALELVKKMDSHGDAALQQEIADIMVWANLGLYFSEKIKGAVALQTYRVQGKDDEKQKAVKHFEQALFFWDAVIAITKPLYQEMPLVHFSEQDGKHWKENDHLRFHWANLREEVEGDIEVARSATHQ
jgi:hypothetical protein